MRNVELYTYMYMYSKSYQFGFLMRGNNQMYISARK